MNRRIGPLLTILLLITLLPACGDKPIDSDFYTFGTIDEYGGGSLWLGMTKDQLPTPMKGWALPSAFMILRYQADGTLQSLSTITPGIFSKLGLTVLTTTADQAQATLGQLPGVSVAWDGDILTATKTIDGVLYTMRISFYASDHTIKEINVCTDLTLEDVKP